MPCRLVDILNLLAVRPFLGFDHFGGWVEEFFLSKLS